MSGTVLANGAADPAAKPDVTVVVVAESPRLRQRICRLLGADAPTVRVVGAADSARSALAMMAEQQPAVAVVTPRIGSVEAGDFIRKAEQASPGSRVILVADSARQEAVLNALRAGARGYVVAGTADGELAAAAASVAEGQAWLSPSVAAQVIEEFVHLPSSVLRNSLRAETYLTQREQSVLARLALGMTNREIADALDVAETTVKTHLRSILDKLSARNRLEAASIALKLALSSTNAGATKLSGPSTGATMDPCLWRDLMRDWPSGVSVLTSLGTLGPRGCTISSLASLSPLLLVVCFDLQSNTLSAVRESGRFCINFLGAEHEALSRRFAEKDPDLPQKFEGVDYRIVEGTPVLADGNAWMVCAVESQLPGGDYAVMLARPLVGARNGDGPPLVFYHGNYWGLKAETAA